ncbi:MAG: hypothetical protein V2I27_15280 [Erythrobacter sp.]|nr:hypothetical protein [Erythrobacter sp.]
MKIKELLQAHSLPSVERRKQDGGKTGETEFDLITVIAQQIRRLRKSDRLRNTACDPAIEQARKGSKSS